ncbi:MAG: hypothetical protein K2M67_00280 [Muribaculaceae bacterium]|nr:hypothetical protein [Muribaculaceae bacterium]
MNTYIENRGRGIAWLYTLFLSLLFLLPQKALAVVETVRYTMNPEEVVCSPKLSESGKVCLNVEWKGQFVSCEVEKVSNLLSEQVFFLVPRDSKNFRVSAKVSSAHAVVRELKNIESSETPTTVSYSLDNVRSCEDVTIPLESHDSAFADVISDGLIFGNWHIVKVAVHPVFYSEVNEALCIEPELEITLSYEEGADSALKHLYPISTRILSEMKESLSSIDFLNKDAASRLIKSQPSTATFSNAMANDKYYIIVPEILEKSVNDLAVWKTQKGYDVTIKTIESILSDPAYKIGNKTSLTNETILDDACALRSYLQDQFSINGIFYCLLVGDWRTSMPIRKYRATGLLEPDDKENGYYYNYYGEYFLPSNDYFADLTSIIPLSNKEASIDKYVADINCTLCPDIFVGRLLCSREEEVSNYFEKLRIYESFPGKGDDSYLTTALYFENNPHSHKYGSSLVSLVGHSTESMNTLDIFSDIIYARDEDVSKGFTAHLIPMDGKDIIKYMRRTGYNSWLGHGHPAGILTCSGNKFIIPINSYSRGIDGQVGRNESDKDVDNGLDLIDNINYPGITYSGACSIAPFDRMEERSHIFDIPYNMAGAYTVSGKNGGVAIIANSRSSALPCVKELQLGFSQQIMRTPNLGVAHLISKSFCKSSDNRTKKISNLIGDPELEMWLNRPKHFYTQDSTDGLLYECNSTFEGAHYTVYDGNTSVYHFISDGTPDPSLATYESYMPLISVWKQGYLPKLTLYARDGKFTNVKKKYFAQEAIFGNSNTSKQCVVGNGASVEVDVMTAIEINDGFHAGNGGKVDIICREDITASGELVKTGGEVRLRGEKIVLEAGFKVESGGSLYLSTF